MTRAELVAAALAPGLLPGERRQVEEWHEEIGDGTDACSGYDGPCGGCTRCLHGQASYYIHVAADRRRRVAGLGLLVPPHPPLYLPELAYVEDETQPYPRACATWDKRRYTDALAAERARLDAAGTVVDG